jgi:hypothetical protein
MSMTIKKSDGGRICLISSKQNFLAFKTENLVSVRSCVMFVINGFVITSGGKEQYNGG